MYVNQITVVQGISSKNSIVLLFHQFALKSLSFILAYFNDEFFVA